MAGSSGEQNSVSSLSLLPLRASLETVQSLRFEYVVLRPKDTPARTRYNDYSGHPGWFCIETGKMLLDTPTLRSHQTSSMFSATKTPKVLVASDAVFAFDGSQKFAYGKSERRGIITFTRDRSLMPPIYSPMKGLGALLHPKLDGTVIDLADSLLNSPVRMINSTTFSIEGIDASPDYPRGNYDIRFEVDADHPDRISWIEKLEVVNKNLIVPARRIEAADYRVFDGIALPMVVTHFKTASVGAEPKRGFVPDWREVFDSESIVINPAISDDSFRIDFPREVKVVDFRNEPNPVSTVETKFEGGLPVEEVSDSVPILGQFSYKVGVLLATIGLIVTAVCVRRARNKSTSTIALLLVASNILGCFSSSANMPTVNSAVEMPRSLVIDIDAGALVEHSLNIPIKNVSDSPIEFDKTFASCGCTKAKLSQPNLAVRGHPVVY